MRYKGKYAQEDEMSMELLAGATLSEMEATYGVAQMHKWWEFLTGPGKRTDKHRIDVATLTAWIATQRRAGEMKPQRRKRMDACRVYSRGVGYLAATDRTGRASCIHRACWEACHGPIPNYHIIHHIDRDKMNNSIENLTCMNRSQHQLFYREKARKESKLREEKTHLHQQRTAVRTS